MAVNKAIILGNITADVQTRFMPSGKAVCNFSLATNEKWKDKDGNQQERAEFHRVTAFDKLAEICGTYLKKGMQVYIEGKLQTSKYTDSKDNTEKFQTVIIANTMQMIGGKKEQNNDFNLDD